MTHDVLYATLQNEFQKIVKENGIEQQHIKINCKLLSPEEAIGITKRKDFPILTGKEIMLTAEFQGELGQAFTDAPSAGSQTLESIINSDISKDPHACSVFIAALNAVTRKLGLSDKTVHCKNDEPEECAHELVKYIQTHYANPKITLIGYQPAMLERLAENFKVRVLDLNPDNIGELRYGIEVEHGVDSYESAIQWADLILCTGSTICNGSIVNFIDIGKEVLFFGTTLSGSAPLLNLKRICFCAS
ncbi:MAG TPA: hypothetical protein DIC60_09375 [Lachnospiraceae bacterium]|nr:hypothetical protein [Lachnospiraceae bacterium]